MRQKYKKNKSTDNMLTIGLFCLVFFGFYFLFSSLNSDRSDQGEYDFASLDRRVDIEVNKNLRGVYDKKQLRDLDVNTEKLKLSQKFKEKFNEQSKDWVPEKGDIAELYEEDLSGGEVRTSTLSVETQLRSQITAQKEREAEERRAKQEYIRKYKENAKKDGWIVELNDNLEVISATPINN